MTPLFTLNPYRVWPVAVLFALLLLLAGVDGVNLWLFRAVNAISLYTGDWVWSNITLFGDTLIVLALLLPFIARRPELVWAMLVSACVVTVVVHVGKTYIHSPRPPAVLPLEGLQLIGYVAKSSSLPSGHTAAAFTMAACMVLLLGVRWWTVVALAVASLVGLSRVVVGIHWPMDVFAGALTGWLGAAAGCYLAARMHFGSRVLAQRLQAALLVLLALVTMAAHDGGYPQGRLLIVLLPLTMLMLAIPGLKQLFSNTTTNREK
jgi:membrane-associated phospholipid phosphatase